MAIELTTATAETLSGIREALSIPTSSKTAKDGADILNLQSYNATIHGNSGFAFQGNRIHKFQYIEQAGAGSFDFSVAGTVNGSPICPSILGDLSSTTVNASNLEMRDDGEGFYYSNYITYLNRVFERLGLYSTLSSGSDRRVIMKYYRSEDFDLIFKETVTGFGVVDNPILHWRWKTIDGLGVKDCNQQNGSEIFYNPLPSDMKPGEYYGAMWSGSIITN